MSEVGGEVKVAKVIGRRLVCWGRVERGQVVIVAATITGVETSQLALDLADKKKEEGR